MSEKPVFISQLKNIFDKYAERCSHEHTAGTLSNDYCALKSFDSYLAEIDFSDHFIPLEVVIEWVSRLSYLSAGRIRVYEQIVGKAMRFATAYGIYCTMPQAIKVPDDFQPYIFSYDELNGLCAAADNIHPWKYRLYPWIRVEVPMILRICIGCGTRISEVLSIQMRDINLTDGIITMRNTKREVERYVPMREQLNAILEKYCVAMRIVDNLGAFLFPGRTTSESLPINVYDNYFNKLVKQIEIPVQRERRRQHSVSAYCIRHTFACLSISHLKKQGIDVNSLYPFLSTYMGHRNLFGTEKYLKMTASMVSEETVQLEDSNKSIWACRVFHDSDEWV